MQSSAAHWRAWATRPINMTLSTRVRLSGEAGASNNATNSRAAACMAGRGAKII